MPMVPPAELLEKWGVLSPIGSGASAYALRVRRLVPPHDIGVAKILQDSAVHDDPQAVQRLTHEVRALLALRHRGLPQVLDVGRSYYVMGEVAGESLASFVMRSGPLQAHVLDALARELCSILAYIHERNVCHRDLKPEHVFVNANGEFSGLVDFGISLMAGHHRLTAPGCAPGSIRWVAPERIRGEPEDWTSCDVYEMGEVLYFAATAQLPFPEDDMIRLLATKADADVIDPGPSVSPFARELVKACTNPAPRKRPTARSLAGVRDAGHPEVHRFSTRQYLITALNRPIVAAIYVAGAIITAGGLSALYLYVANNNTTSAGPTFVVNGGQVNGPVSLSSQETTAGITSDEDSIPPAEDTGATKTLPNIDRTKPVTAKAKSEPRAKSTGSVTRQTSTATKRTEPEHGDATHQSSGTSGATASTSNVPPSGKTSGVTATQTSGASGPVKASQTSTGTITQEDLNELYK